MPVAESGGVTMDGESSGRPKQEALERTAAVLEAARRIAELAAAELRRSRAVREQVDQVMTDARRVTEVRSEPSRPGRDPGGANGTSKK